MSRGHGRVQQAILEAISAPAALAANKDGTGPVGTGIEAVYTELYGTPAPTRAQRQSVRHALDRLGPEQVQHWSWRSYDSSAPRRTAGTRTRSRQPRYWATCTGDDSCGPCEYGNKAEALYDFEHERFEQTCPGTLAEALERGVHRWTDYRPGARLTETIDVQTWYGDRQTWIARPSTGAEAAASEAASEARMAEFRARLGR